MDSPPPPCSVYDLAPILLEHDDGSVLERNVTNGGAGVNIQVTEYGVVRDDTRQRIEALSGALGMLLGLNLGKRYCPPSVGVMLQNLDSSYHWCMWLGVDWSSYGGASDGRSMYDNLCR